MAANAALLALGDAIAGLMEEAARELPTDGSANLKQAAGALRFVGAQGGAALVDFLAAVLASRRHDALMAVELAAIAGDCAHLLRDALRAMAVGQTAPVASLLPCWQRLASMATDQDTHPCQLLTLSPTTDTPYRHTDGLQGSVPSAATTLELLVCEVDRALLDFLRCHADSERQRAAQTIAIALASIATRQAVPHDQLRWRVLQAFAEEVAAGQRYESVRAKRILSAAGRQVRRLHRFAHHVPTDALLREALYELACHACLTAVARFVSEAYALPVQVPAQVMPEDERLIDADVAFERDLQTLLANCNKGEGEADGMAHDLSADGKVVAGTASSASPAKPVAARMVRALSEALRDSVAAIERQVDAARGRSEWNGVFNELRPLVRQIDAGVQMLGHADLQATVGEAIVELDRLSQRSGRGDEGPDDDACWQAFATRLAMLELGMATLPFRRDANDTDAIDATDAVAHPGVAPSLRQIFIAEARARLDQLHNSLVIWEAVPTKGLSVQAGIDAHALAGSAATVGWSAIHVLAQSLELACEACALRACSNDDVVMLGDAIAAIRQFLAAGMNPDATKAGIGIDPTLLDRLRALAHQLQLENALHHGDAPAGDAIRAATDIIERAGPPTVLAFAPPGCHQPSERQSGPARRTGLSDALPDTVMDVAPAGELRMIFDEEAADLLPQLDHAMRAWLTRPDDPAPPAHLMRVLHTLKGSARMAGESLLGDVFHDLESRVSGMLAADPISLALLHELQVEFDTVLEAGRRCATTAPDMVMTTAVPACLPGQSPASGANGDGVHGFASAPASIPASMPTPKSASNPASNPASMSQRQHAGATVPTGDASPRLRVPAALLGRMTDAAAELLVGMHEQSNELGALRQEACELADNLGRLRAQLRELEIEADARIASYERRGDETGFDPLEFDRYTRVHELTRTMSESVADLAEVQRMVVRRSASLAWSNGQRQRQLRALHADLLQAGTSPFGSLEARLMQTMRQAVRDAATGPAGHVAPDQASAGREVSLLLEGGEHAVDRSLLERIAAPLEHLVRNAVAHGIEPMAERERLGKPRCASLRIRLSRDANQWRLEIADDGRGLDLARLRERAVAMGVANFGKVDKFDKFASNAGEGKASDEPAMADAPIDAPAIAELIFVRGLSTSDTLTGLAGRGIGMDAVRAAVQSLGGAISVHSDAGRGCRFVLNLPLTLAILPVLVCRAGPHCIGVPSSMVTQVLKPDALRPADGVAGDEVEWQGETYRRRSLAALLRVPAGATARRMTTLLLAQAGSRLALAVDSVDAHRELTLRDPGPQLLSVHGMIAASPAAAGGIVLVMNPFALAAAGPLLVTPASGIAAPDAATADTSAIAAPAAPSPTIMVVDDSLTVRRATQGMLQRQGYHVMLARDGAEALALLANADAPGPQAMLLDIEMPKMDGFELLSLLRGDARWQQLPVVMITSRTADKHRERALQLGATAYVGKPYQEEELVALLSGLVAQAMTAHEPAASLPSCTA